MQQPSAQGIASLFRGNPAPLQQRIEQEQQGKPGLPPDLQKLLALNIVTNEENAMAQQQALNQLAQMQGPQGKPPTVMESVQEQARQKMEAQQVQAQQQQQAMQAMMQQAGPGPVPPDTPQPQRQPQGIDELPVEFQMAGGGIIAFQEGKRVPRIQDEVGISDEERTRLERELLMRIIGEETRNPPPPKQPPMEITESDLSTIPGLESGDLYTRAMREATGPQPDNRAMLNAAEANAARKNAMLDREREKAASRPKYETSYDRMNRKNRGEMTEEERQAQVARDALIAQIPTGGDGSVTGGERVDSSEAERRIKNTFVALPGASASRGLSGSSGSARGVLAGLVGLLGLDKNKTSEKAAAAPQERPPSKAEESGYSKEGRTGARPYTPEPKPATDLRALADQQRRQQAPRPAPAAPAPMPAVAPAAPEVVPAQESDAAKMLKARMALDPMAERVAEQELRRREIGAPDTSTHDRMIAELEKRKAQLEGPQDSFGQLMEYLGQIAATPRGMSSFEAGAAGAANLSKVQKARQLEQFDLSKQALEVSQKKIDTVRTFATEQYNVGKTRFDQVYKEQFEAAKEITKDEGEARKLAQENTLKRLELEQRATEARERNKTQLQGYSMQQLGERNEQARIDKITSLKQQARRATDPKIAAELMAQATDLEALVGRGGGGAGVAADRQELAELKALLKNAEETAGNPMLPKPTRDAAVKRMEEINRQIAGMTKMGSGATTPPTAGKVPPPPPGFKLN